MIPAETLLDGMAFAGIALLSIPVLTLDRAKKLSTDSAWEVALRNREGPSALDPVARSVSVEAAQAVSTWRSRDRICLWTGYGLLFASGLARIFT